MVISQFSSLPLFAEVRGRVFLRSSPNPHSPKFGLNHPRDPSVFLL
jgi:hypothetical protein